MPVCCSAAGRDRRTRRTPSAFHVLAIDGRLGGAVEWETDRARFLGRGRSAASPVALDGRALSGTTGAVLDPVASVRERVRLPPGAFVRLTFATGIARDRQTALALVRKYRDGSAAARAFSMASTHAHITLQHLGLTDDHAMLFDRLASRVFGSDESCASPGRHRRETSCGQPNLWGYGISGDLPIVLVHVTDANGVPLVRQLLHAQEYWRVKGLGADLVILNDHPADYLDEMQSQLSNLVQEPRWSRMAGQAGRNVPAAVGRHAGGRTAGFSRPSRASFSAAISVSWRRSSIARRRGSRRAKSFHRRADCGGLKNHRPSRRRLRRVMENGIGGFTPDGREYVVVLEGERETPLPWINVLANAEFGTILSTSGAAFTWAGNSRENRLTPFANDPIADPTGEAILLRDEADGAVWGATPGPLPPRRRLGPVDDPPRSGRDALRVWGRRPGAGSGGLRRTRRSGQTVAADVDEHVAHRTAHQRIRLRGVGPRPAARRRAPLRGLGTSRRRAPRRETRTTRNSSDRVAFLRATEPPRSFTCDRSDFIGRNRSLSEPAALFRESLDGRVGAGLDPCAALQISVVIPAGESRSIAFTLGQGQNPAHAEELLARYGQLADVQNAVERSRRFWDRHARGDPGSNARRLVRSARESLAPLSDARVPDLGPEWPLPAGRRVRFPRSAAGRSRAPLFASRLVSIARPAARRRGNSSRGTFSTGGIRRAAEAHGRGVQTILLWLPYVAATYVANTGDRSLLRRGRAVSRGPAARAGSDRDVRAAGNLARKSVGVRSLRSAPSIARLKYGAHGLPLIGSGDWNDGMNRVGQEGRGESVWLGWFLVVDPQAVRRDLR